MFHQAVPSELLMCTSTRLKTVLFGGVTLWLNSSLLLSLRSCFSQVRYRADWSTETAFSSILISPRMLTDHMPDAVLRALNGLTSERPFSLCPSALNNSQHNTVWPEPQMDSFSSMLSLLLFIHKPSDFLPTWSWLTSALHKYLGRKADN